MVRAIDTHVHLYPPEVNADPAGWARAAEEAHWSELCTRRRRDGRPVQGFPDEAGLLRAMDAADVERAVLLGWYWQTPAACAAQNRFYAGCMKRHPDRLDAFAALHPASGPERALAEVRRAKDEGFRGLGEFSPHSQGYPVDDAVFGEILSAAAELRMPVNLHVTDPEGRPYPGRVETPLSDFERLARHFPSCTFILAHFGGLLPLRSDAVPPNVFYDTAASPLLYGPEIWRRFVGRVGADRVLFGSDYPLILYPKLAVEPEMGRLVAEVRDAGIGPGALAAVLRGNAQRLLGIR